MCKTHVTLGIKWPQWHTLIPLKVNVQELNMSHVCPKDVKKMLMKQARSTLLEEVGSEA